MDEKSLFVLNPTGLLFKNLLLLFWSMRIVGAAMSAVASPCSHGIGSDRQVLWF